MIISKTYLNFFKKTSKERIIFLKGGRRGGKTYAIFYKFAHNLEKGSGGDVLICAPTHSALGTLMNDFSYIFNIEPEYRQKKGEYRAKWYGGTFRFRIFSSGQEAKGTKAKWLWINEGDGVPAEIYDTLKLGIEKQIVCDHNPTHNFWGTNLQNDNNTLTTSYKDNIFLTPEQISEFETIEAKGKDAPPGSPERVSYERQILGNYSKITGNIFTRGNIIFKKLTNVNLDVDKCKFIITVDPSSLRGADYFAMVMACKLEKINYFIKYLSVNTGTKKEMVEVLFNWQEESNAEIFIETNGIIGIDFFEYCDSNGLTVNSYNSKGNKFERITANYEEITQRAIFNETANSESFFSQVYDFSDKCDNDDNIDCISTAIDILKYY